MSVEKCPYCYRNVLPGPDRNCPSCKHSLDKKPTDERAGKSLLWLGKTTKLPPICVQCGNPTEETVKLQEFSTNRLEAFFSHFFRGKLISAVIVLFRPDLVMEGEYRMMRKVPCCSKCRGSNPIKIHSKDHQLFRIGILVRDEIHGRIENSP